MNLLINGIRGKMGNIIKERALEDGFWSNIYGIDQDVNDLNDGIKIDVIIDFSHALALDNILNIAIDKGLPLVIGTTGHTDIQLEKVREVSKLIPVFQATNMSLGMNLLFALVEETAKILGNNSDIEVLEAHHNRKKDAPSGSAVTIVESIEKGLGERRHHQHGRVGECPRQKGEIGIHAIRGGNIVGYHEANFINELESIKIVHEAYDRNVFAAGALEAAKFIIGKEPKLYGMKDILNI